MRRLLPTLLLLFAALPPASAADNATDATAASKRSREIYLLARMGRAKEAEALARDYLAANPGDRTVRLTLCALFAQQGRIGNLRKAARDYLALYPRDPQGLYYLASAEYRAGHYTEAVRILRDIRTLSPQGAVDPYLADMAADAWASGDWKESLQAHLELLRNAQLSPELRMSLRRQLDELYRRHMDVARAGAEYLTYGNGEALRTSASEEAQVADDLRVEAAYRNDAVWLKRAAGVASVSDFRQEGALRFLWTHDTLWHSEYTVGAYGAGALGKIRVDYALNNRRSWYAEGTAFGRATDSLLLEAADGRESRLETGGGIHLSETLVLSAEGHARLVTVGGATLGDGVGGEWRLAKTLWQGSPSLTASLRGTCDAFDRTGNVNVARFADPAFPGTNLADVLVPGLFHREGAEIEWAGRFGAAWPYRCFATVDYDLVSSSPVYGAGCELAFRPRKTLEFAGRFEYQSAGTGGNADTDAFLFALTARFYH